jgi:D-tyrosyl-tRNA(Tyr) deacylase
MRLVIQRVSEASVLIGGKVHASIAKGFLVFVGIEDADTEDDASWLAGKLTQLRIFNDEHGLMNLGLKDMGAGLLVVSQFTLHASTKKGNRPSFIRASRPEKAIPLYEFFISQCENMLGNKIQTGVFGADMKIQLINDGPVTIWMDSKEKE